MNDENETPTPRTDAVAGEGWSGDVELAPLEFTKQLECELIAKDKALQDATEAFNEASRHSVEVIAAITRERDEARSCNDKAICIYCLKVGEKNPQAMIDHASSCEKHPLHKLIETQKKVAEFQILYTKEITTLTKDKQRLEFLISHQGCVTCVDDDSAGDETWEFYSELKAAPYGEGDSAIAAIDDAMLKEKCGECGDDTREKVLCEKCQSEAWVCKYNHIVKACECEDCPVGSTWVEEGD